MASSEPRKTDQFQASYINQQTDTEFFPRKTRYASNHNIHHIHLSLFALDHPHTRPTTILSCLSELWGAICFIFFGWIVWFNGVSLNLACLLLSRLLCPLSCLSFATWPVRMDWTDNDWWLVSNCCVWITALFLFLTSAPRLLLCHSATLPAISLRKLVCQYLILGSCICCFCCFHWCCVALHWLYETFGDTSLLLINTTHASVAIWRVAN